MFLAQETAVCSWQNINWTVALVGLQALTLLYMVYAFRRIARNQSELAECIREKMDQDD